MFVDESAGAAVRQLGGAWTELEVNGHFFGSLTLVLFENGVKAVDRSATEAVMAIGTHDEETVQ